VRVREGGKVMREEKRGNGMGEEERGWMKMREGGQGVPFKSN
jgi:hypothetical protein